MNTYIRKAHCHSLEMERAFRHAESSFYHASLSPGLECFAVVRRSINMCLVTRNVLSLWVDARRRKKVSDKHNWESQRVSQSLLKWIQETGNS